MPPTTLPTSLQAKITKTYRRALRGIAHARAIPENEVSTSATLRRAVFDHAVSELLADGTADIFAGLFAPTPCSRRGCGNDATITEQFTDDEWCSNPCRQWERQTRRREQRAAERRLVAA